MEKRNFTSFINWNIWFQLYSDWNHQRIRMNVVLSLSDLPPEPQIFSIPHLSILVRFVTSLHPCLNTHHTTQFTLIAFILRKTWILFDLSPNNWMSNYFHQQGNLVRVQSLGRELSNTYKQVDQKEYFLFLDSEFVMFCFLCVIFNKQPVVFIGYFCG